MAAVAELLDHDVEVVITHGNGPQVGNLLVKNELAAAVVPPVPLDWCGAQTQATLGFVLMDALDVALAERGIDERSATVVTRTLVDAARPRLRSPDQADRTVPAGRGGRAARRARRDVGGPRREGLAPGRRLARAARHPRRAGRAAAGRCRVRGRGQRRRWHPRRTTGRRVALGRRGRDRQGPRGGAARRPRRGRPAGRRDRRTRRPCCGFGTPEAQPTGTDRAGARCRRTPRRGTSRAARWARRSTRCAASCRAPTSRP